MPVRGCYFSNEAGSMSGHEVSEETVTKYVGLGSIFVHPPCGWVRNSDPSDQISQRVPSGSTLTVGCS